MWKKILSLIGLQNFGMDMHVFKKGNVQRENCSFNNCPRRHLIAWLQF
jgi:hypothetical protein